MFGIPVTWMWAGGLVVVAGLVGSAGGVGYRTGTHLKQGEWDAAVLRNRAGEDAALKAAAEAIAKIEVKSEKHIQPVRVEIRTNTVYRDCVHSDDSLRNLNALIEGAEPAGDRVVSPADGAR